jgi:hypothetical protein
MPSFREDIGIGNRVVHAMHISVYRFYLRRKSFSFYLMLIDQLHKKKPGIR